MRYDEVAERGGETSPLQSWNAERKVVAIWSCGSDVEGAAEADVWRGRNKSGVGEGG